MGVCVSETCCSLEVKYLLILGISSFVLGCVLLPLWKKVAQWLGCVDLPGVRKIHNHTVPLAGGLAVVFPLILLFIDEIFPNIICFSPVCWEQKMLLLCGFWAFGIGLLDDFRELEALPKLMLQIVLFILMLLLGIRFQFIENIYLSCLVSAVWIFVVMNAFNFLDNMNGLCTGLGILGGTALVTVFVILKGLVACDGIEFCGELMIVFVAALLGFLPWNYPKAKAFLGDSGSQMVGFFMASGSIGMVNVIYCNLVDGQISDVKATVGAILPILLILAVPLYDFVSVMLIRIKNRKPIYIGDTNHTSHRLVRRGWSPAQAVGIIWGWMLGFCVLGVILSRFVI